MKIAIGSDHAGYQAKNLLKEKLTAQGLTIEDFGTHSEDSCDYPDFAGAVAKSVASGEHSYGVLVCGSGIGVSISANKVPGIRALVCHNQDEAELSRQHNNANVICFGARFMEVDQMTDLTLKWLNTEFEGNRHQRRVDKIHQLEKSEGVSS